MASTSSAPAAGLPARHKYANLPDVDITAPDVYETPSVPRARRRKYRTRNDTDIEGRKTAGGANDNGDGYGQDDEDYSLESQSDESIESSDDDMPYKVRKVPQGWTKAAPRVEAQSEDILRTSLKHFEADKKFRDAVELDGSRIDFSDKLKKAAGKRRELAGARRGRDAGIATSSYQLGGVNSSGETRASESLVDRLRRLKFEANLIEEELTKSSGAAELGEEEGQKTTDVAAVTSSGKDALDEVPLPELFSQLRILKSQVAQLDSTYNGAEETTSSKDSLAWEAKTRELLQKLAAGGASASTNVLDAVSPPNQEAGSPQPLSSKAGATNIGTLDRRLAELEEALGVNEALLDDNKAMPKPILPTLSRLEQQLQLLSQPRHLDAISRRVKVLVTELDRVQDSRSKLLASDGSALPLHLGSGGGASSTSGQPVDASSGSTNRAGLTADEVTKVQQLFDVSTRLDPLLPLIPTLLGRMQTLADLHASSAHFAQTLDRLEARKQLRDAEDGETSELLARLEKSMDENAERMQGNLSSLEERIRSLTARLEKLD